MQFQMKIPSTLSALEQQKLAEVTCKFEVGYLRFALITLVQYVEDHGVALKP